MMVCLGMGPAAGIAGLCVHTTAFFTRAFAQSFESIPQETIEALEATGVGRIGVFFNAVLPAALSQLVAWIAMRFEINFSLFGMCYFGHDWRRRHWFYHCAQHTGL